MLYDWLLLKLDSLYVKTLDGSSTIQSLNKTDMFDRMNQKLVGESYVTITGCYSDCRHGVKRDGLDLSHVLQVSMFIKNKTFVF